MKKKRNMSFFTLFCLILLLIIIVFSMSIEWIRPVDLGATNLRARLIPPCFAEKGQPEYLLGTDKLGRDVALRLVYATRNTILIAFSSTFIAMLLGCTLGVVSGFKRGLTDTLISFVVDARMSIPIIIFAIVLVSVFGSSKLSLVLIMGLTGWTQFTRLTRGQIIQIREAEFINASASIGASRTRILFEHILHNIASPIIVQATLRLCSFIILESSLSFLGVGITAPDVSLGVLVSEGRNNLLSQWWLAIIPSIMIIVIVLLVSQLGDWLRDSFDPKLRTNSVS